MAAKLFEAHCRERGLTILRELQAEVVGYRPVNAVYLVLDVDGLVKVFKQLPDLVTLKKPEIDEAEAYRLIGTQKFLPKAYGVTELSDGSRWLRLETCYGQPLTDFVQSGKPLDQTEAEHIIGQLAEAIAMLHSRRLLYMDIRPENVIVNGQDIRLLDLGDVCHVAELHETFATYMHDTVYTAPETFLRGEASAATDIFQLGILSYQLLTGEHPFADPIEVERDEEQRVRYKKAHTLSTPKCVLAERDSKFAIIDKMLARDQNDRPTAAEIRDAFKSATVIDVKHRARKPIPATNGTVLFPARLGVPHRGHIDYISRLLELGFKVTIALQMSYAHSSEDPLPKWLVMKMIGQALRERGFSESSFRIYCSPYFATDALYRMHFAMLRGQENIVAVASGNPEVQRLLGTDLPVIGQAHVFGSEGEAFEVRSWGARLREAIRRGDRETFRSLVAPGVETILSFEQLQAYCAEQSPLQFVWGHDNWGQVFAVIYDMMGKVLKKTRVSSFSSPEEALIHDFPGTKVLDLYNATTIFEMDGLRRHLYYIGAKLDKTNNMIIGFNLLDEEDQE